MINKRKILVEWLWLVALLVAICFLAPRSCHANDYTFLERKPRVTTYESGNRSWYYVDGDRVGMVKTYKHTGGKRVRHYYDDDGDVISKAEFEYMLGGGRL